MNQLIRARDLKSTLWKNGQGTTREIYVFPAHADWQSFDWRLSIADVTQSGVFSQFLGIDRWLMLLSGNGMRLSSKDGHHTLTQLYDVAHFPGETEITADLLNGSTTDFNLMVRRDCFFVEYQCISCLESTQTLLSFANVLIFFSLSESSLRFDDQDVIKMALFDTYILQRKEKEALPISFEFISGKFLVIELYRK